jgi:hypothetical protein
MKLRVVKILMFLIFSFNLFSCANDKYDNEMLYNSVGFEPGSIPNQTQGAKVAPDYYYRQTPPTSPYGNPNPPYQQYPQQPAPYQNQYYQPPYSAAPYQIYPNAGSRFYSNPYAIPPSPYNPQYDVDQYYVPPTYSYGVEQNYGNRSSISIQK